jgi:predicted ATPase
MGDPYLPFRETLAMLTADVESRWAAGGISLEQSRRLWENCPFTAQTLVDGGPDLVGVFIPAAGLHSRICAAVPENSTLQQSLMALVEKERATPDRLEQKALFEQYTSVLAEIAGRHPLLVMLDDLQWADTASINLLFHLGRHLAGRRILIVGAYRSEEITLGREEGRHPLESVLNEFKRVYGDTEINLSHDPEGEAKQFVGAILDSEPNLLGEGFREALFEHTDGHPLFTVELLRDLQERGDLVQVENSGWVEGPSLDWSVLPARVEGVIEERIGRLQQDLRESLTVASVEGEDFTAQVVAGVRNEDTRQLVHQLSGELDKKHRLVAERGTTQVADQPLYLYHFRHNLFQQHIYNGLGEIERKMLHKDVGEVLEVLYGDETARISSQLAMHFSRAGE